MENKLDYSNSLHSRAPIRSADTAVVRAITHEDELRHAGGRSANANRPAVKTASGTKNMSNGNRTSRTSAQVRSTAKVADAPKVKEKSRVLPLTFLLFLSVMILALYGAIKVYDRETNKINRKITVEVGSPVYEELFFNDTLSFPDYEECNLDFSGVKIDIPQTIHFTITYFWTDMECELDIADTTPPTGIGIPQQMFSVDELPEASKCVKDVKDRTDVTIKWGKIPDISAGGEFKAEALLTDACGNTASIKVPLSVTRDSTPPVIEGTKDIKAFIEVTKDGVSDSKGIVYRDGVTVTDDYDENPKLSIDTTQVNLNKPGKYKVTYVATDFSGNKSTAEITVELVEKPKSYIDDETVHKAARKVLNKIIKDGMTQKEKALQIVWWCRYNIGYVSKADSSSRNRAAYDAITKKRATCYGFACAVREMLNLCDIENMFIKRYPFRWSVHYWNYINIDGQWYHCDSTPRKGYKSYFFMYTTKELQSFYHNGWNGYNFKVDQYPASATKSVQKTIDYGNHKVKK